MLKRKDHYQVFYAILIIFFLVFHMIQKSHAAPTQEAQDRNVDEAALSIQLNAIATVQNHLKKPKNTEQEQRLLLKLSEYFIEKSALEFRISFGSTQTAKKNKFLMDYQNSLRQASHFLGILIQKHPQFEDLDQAFYMRAKSYQDLEMKSLSEKDYFTVVKKYPQSRYALPSFMSLGEYAVERNEHEKALEYFHAIEAFPASPYYPFALFKSAWSYYNLKNAEKSLNYLEKHLSFYLEKEKREKGLTVSDFAVKENTLLDMALFYFEAIENHPSSYKVEAALAYFSQFDQKDILGKMSTRFTKLLRTREYHKELFAFKNQFLEKYPQNPSSLSIVMTSFEHFIQRRQWPEALSTSKDFVKLYQKFPMAISKNETYPEAQEMLLKNAEDIRKFTLKNKNATKINELTEVLAGLYESFTLFVPEQDARIPGAYYNLAETLFSIQQFEKAKNNYRWIVENKKRINPSLIHIQEVELKAIASFYEVLKSKKIIALEVKAQIIPKTPPSPPPALHIEFSEWMKWLQAYHSTPLPKSKEFEAFYFEGLRSLYRFQNYTEALTLLQDFVEKYPRSEFTQAAALLSLDSYTLSLDWKNAHNYANRLRKSQLFIKSEFENKLFEIASTSYFKIAEEAYTQKKYELTLELCEDHMKRYGSSPIASECLFISSQSAIHLENEKTAQKYLSDLIKNHTQSRHYLSAFYSRGKIFETHYQLPLALNDLMFYYTQKIKDKKEPLSADKLLTLKKSILQLNTFLLNTAQLSTLVQSNDFCDKSLIDECTTFLALSLLESPENSFQNRNFYEEFKKQKTPSLKLLYGMSALKHQKNLSTPLMQEILLSLSKNYAEADSVTQNTLSYYLNDSLVHHYKTIRNAVTPKGSLKAQESSISHRIKKIEELEKLATQLVLLPWKKLQIDLLSETAQLYFDFAQELERLSSAPQASPEQNELKELVSPFINKGLAINKKALEISQKVIIDRNIRDRLEDIQNRNLASLSLTAEKDSENKKLSLPLTLIPNIDFFDKLAPSLSLKKALSQTLVFEKKNEKEFIIFQALEAVQKKRFYLAKHYIDLLEGKKLLKNNESLILKSYYLAETGASAESFYELSQNISALEKESKNYMTLSLAAYYTYTQDESTAQDWLKKFMSIAESEQKFYSRYAHSPHENFLIAYGIIQYKLKYNPTYLQDLLTSVKAYGSPEQSEWAQKVLLNNPIKTAGL